MNKSIASMALAAFFACAAEGEDSVVRGFSQTHLNGTGRPAMGDISILPFVSTGLTGLTGLSGGYPPAPQNPVNLVNPVQNKLLTLMVQSMMNNDGENPKNCWNAYWENGYIPYFAGEHDVHVPKGQSVSTTLELAYDWWCIADFAKTIGDAKTAKEASKWADCWRNVFDEKTGFARPRAPKTAGGAWREPFDPANPRAGGRRNQCGEEDGHDFHCMHYIIIFVPQFWNVRCHGGRTGVFISAFFQNQDSFACLAGCTNMGVCDFICGNCKISVLWSF